MSLRRVVLAIGLAAVLGVGAVWFFELRDTGTTVETTPHASASLQTIERGAYLVRVGNCGACHTARGGSPFAGGRGIDTPFGTVYATNLTPDPEHGIGRWSAGQFWRALHEGRSADGRLLYPAFPYPNYTLVTRDDSDAMFDYLQSLPPVPQPDRAHALRFPYDTQFALAVWRLVFFRTAAFEPDASRPASWNRGAYLVQGLAHCGACHAERNVFGATRENLGLSGGLIPMTNWYAPSLTSPDEASLAGWNRQEVAALLGTGSSARASTMGPMAEVVFRSIQYLSAEDLDAMATYLAALPQDPPRPTASAAQLSPALRERGARLYADHCQDCHGAEGRGEAGAWPALAGNRAVTMRVASNSIRAVLNGGYLPATTGNPRPYGMPPFAQALGDADVAAVLSYVRNSWGNAAPAVEPHEVSRQRQGSVH